MTDGKIDTTFNNPLGYNILDTLPNNLVVLSTGGSIIRDNLGKIFNVNTVGDTNTNEFYLMITRYTNSGILDTGFGTNGYILDRFLNTNTWAINAIIDSNNNILIVGFLGTDSMSVFTELFVARYTNDGVLDTTFNSPTGYNIISFGVSKVIGNSIGIDNLGNIVVGGNYSTFINPSEASFIVAKYNSNGILVNGFGTSGYLIGQIENNITDLRSLVIDDNNNILITGALYGISKTYIAKYTSNGGIDTSFNNPTGYIIPDNTNCRSTSITIDNLGRIVVGAASTLLLVDTDIIIFRYKNTGQIDTDFNNIGYMTYPLNSYVKIGEVPLVVKTDTNNDVVCISSNTTNTISNLLLFRVTNSGVLDTTFNSPDGFVLTDFGSGKETSGFNIYIDSNHSILVSGIITTDQTNTNLVTARYYGLPPTTTTLPPTTTTLPPTTTTEPPTTTTEPICLPAGTPILTDQGSLAIEKIDTAVHTINNKRIVAVTRTITPEKYLVCFEANSIGINCPSKRTIMTPGHEVLYKGKLVQSKYFVGRVDGVHTLPYNGTDVLYNVLLEQHGLMRVNNMILETLNPDNKVAKELLKNI